MPFRLLTLEMATKPSNTRLWLGYSIKCGAPREKTIA